MAEGIDIGLEVIAALKEQVPEYYDALVTSMSHGATFADKQLDQAWRIAELNESGANSRAGMSAAASRHAATTSANASMRNAALQAKTQRYGIDMDRLTAQERLALERELGYADVGLKQGGLGLDYLKTQAGLRGPEDILQAADFARGASARQDVPIFLQNLMQGVGGPVFQAPGGAPAGTTMGGLMAKLGAGNGGTGAPGQTGQNQTFLQAARALAQRGFHTLGNGLNALSGDELGALKGAVEYGADGGPSWNWNELLRQNQNAQFAQGNPFAA